MATKKGRGRRFIVAAALFWGAALAAVVATAANGDAEETGERESAQARTSGAVETSLTTDAADVSEISAAEAASAEATDDVFFAVKREDWRRVEEGAFAFWNEMQAKETPLCDELARRFALFASAVKPSVYLEAYLYCLIVVVISALANLASRTLRGASPFYLFRTRFYEIPEIRVQLQILRCFCWTVVVFWGIITFRWGVAYLDDLKNARLGVFFGLTVLALVALFFVVRKISALFFVLPGFIPNCKKNDLQITFRNRVSRWRLARLGRESFPEELEFGRTGALAARWFLIFAQTATVVGLGVAFFTEYGRSSGWAVWATRTAESASAQIPELQPVWALLLCVSGSLLLLFLLTSDRNYLILRFPTAFLVGATLATAIFFGFCSFDASLQNRAIAFGVLNFAFFCRWSADVKLAWRYKRTRKATVPVSKKLARRYRAALKSIIKSDECELEPLDAHSISQRVERGLRNVERVGFAALRNMIRYIGVVKAESERFAAMKFQAMTVDRKLTARCVGGTLLGLRKPSVSYWNETLFPLRPPQGYQTNDDYLWLNSEYDVVTICGACGGTGQTKREETEYYTDSSGNQCSRTKTVYATCGGCSGCGRILYNQAIVTMWRVFTALATEPATPSPEFMENAAEKTYWTKALVEDREFSNRASTRVDVGDDLRQELEAACDRTDRRELDSYMAAASKLRGGVVYRAELRAVGFWTIRIVFRRLFGRFGWFFGANPDFYFRTIPLSFSSIVAIGFGVPLGVATATTVGFALWNVLQVFNLQCYEAWNALIAMFG